MRYGWTDEYILSLPFARLKQIIYIIGEARADEQKTSLQRASFTAWLVLSGFGMNVSFSEYLGNLGLGGDEGTESRDSLVDTNNITKDEALAIADKVVQHFREKGYTKAIIAE